MESVPDPFHYFSQPEVSGPPQVVPGIKGSHFRHFSQPEVSAPPQVVPGIKDSHFRHFSQPEVSGPPQVVPGIKDSHFRHFSQPEVSGPPTEATEAHFFVYLPKLSLEIKRFIITTGKLPIVGLYIRVGIPT